MKKVIVAFDGLHFSKGAVNYAIQLAKDSGSVITGVFLHDLYYRYGASATVLEGQPFFDGGFILWVQRLIKGNGIQLAHLVAGVGKPLGQFAIVGKQ